MKAIYGKTVRDLLLDDIKALTKIHIDILSIKSTDKDVRKTVCEAHEIVHQALNKLYENINE